MNDQMEPANLKHHQSRRPSLRRTAREAIAPIISSPKLSLDQLTAPVPRGDGHTVLVLPALCRGDQYTSEVRKCLTGLGYATHGWNLGMNIGPTKRLLDGAENLLIGLADKHGPVSIVGFSMGGLFARWLALQMPACVRQVITVCSPIREPARNFWLPLEPLINLWPRSNLHKLAEHVGQSLPVPGTFLFSRAGLLISRWQATARATW